MANPSLTVIHIGTQIIEGPDGEHRQPFEPFDVRIPWFVRNLNPRLQGVGEYNDRLGQMGKDELKAQARKRTEHGPGGEFDLRQGAEKLRAALAYGDDHPYGESDEGDS